MLEEGDMIPDNIPTQQNLCKKKFIDWDILMN
jgi:hypothetical protein